jgi:hypothetical protein
MCSGDHDFQCAAVVHRAGMPGIRKEQSRRQPTEAPTALLSSPSRAPRHVWAVGSAVTESAPMSRLGKRVVLLRLFYGGEMQKCDSVVRVCFFHPIYRNHVAPILFKGLDERRPPTPPSPPAAALFRAPRGAKPAEPFSFAPCSSVFAATMSLRPCLCNNRSGASVGGSTIP